MQPKLKIKVASLAREKEQFKIFLDTGFAKFIHQMYPELKGVKGKDLEAVVRRLHFERSNKVKARVKQVKQEWAQKGPKFMETISKMMGTEWFEREISCHVSVAEMNPRFLEYVEFMMFYDYPMEKTMEGIYHELTHFIYFKKFGELFPKVEKKRYNVPYPEWLLSEIIAPIMLADPRLKDFVKIKPTEYKAFVNIKVGNVKIMDYFSRMYTDYMRKGKTFDDFLKDAYKVIQKDYDRYFLRI